MTESLFGGSDLRMALDPIPCQPDPIPGIPVSLHGLQTLAFNLRWTWRPQTQELFQELDSAARKGHQSPVRILKAVRDWTPWTANRAFVASVQNEERELKNYLRGPNAPPAQKGRIGPVVYFCAEYALHTGMNQYAGGLGILAGDHCKEASDQGFPFVAVGLFYRRGFFRQMLDWSGRQECLYPTYEPADLPMCRVLKPGTRRPLTVEVELPGRSVKAAVWLIEVGRTPLLLLDTDLPENTIADRKITSQLYTNFREMRLHQEVVLGAGGVRALRALGIEPACWHLNEGHSAMLLVERLREETVIGATFARARKQVAKNSILTIHTPVPEGNERFDRSLTERLLIPLLAGSPIKPEAILKLGRGADADPGVFDMTALALRHTSRANGVSLLHGRTADKSWRAIHGRPIIGVTNGAHMPTWLGTEMGRLYGAAGLTEKTALPEGNEERPDWTQAHNVNSEDLWEAHRAQKRRLIAWAQEHLFEMRARHGADPEELASYADCLDPDALLIGFSRRFAIYKRASLLFTDPRRLSRLLDGPYGKVQILFAGKSHPADRSGQKLIERVFALARSPRFRGKVFLLEDYDMEAGAMLTQGADLWLNNPRRPLEASGTSGMKAAANGVPNCSILDGWWDEAYRGGRTRNGWAIGGRRTFKDPAKQDRYDADALYDVLESEVLPAFFERNKAGLPERWIAVMKQAISSSLYSFSTARMLRDYANLMYKPAGLK